MPLPQEIVRYTVASDPEAVGDTRVRRFKISSSAVARDGHTLATTGWQLDNFRKNPVVLAAHDSKHIESVIGRAVDLPVQGDDLFADVEFMPGEINPLAEMTLQMVDAGFLRATSVGFSPLDGKPSKRGPGTYDFSKQELLELSIVPVGSLPDALLAARSAGIDTTPALEWAKRIVETADMGQMNRASQHDWKCGAARDLPVGDSEEWDGPAAAKAILDGAEGADGKIDAAKAKRGFLIYDSTNSTERGAYKEPFATMVGGKLTVTKGGVKAAASRLPQVSGASQEVIDEARTVLNGYEEKLGMGDKSGGARAPKKIMKRDLYDCGWLAELLGSLACLQQWAEWEAQNEEDNSPIPAMIADAVKTLGDILVKMTAEEVAELVADMDGAERATDTPGQRILKTLARRSAPQQPAIAVNGTLTKGDIAKMRAWWDSHTRAGKTISAESERCIRSAHDHLGQASNILMGLVEPDEGDAGGDGEGERAAKAKRERMVKIAQAEASLLS